MDGPRRINEEITLYYCGWFISSEALACAHAGFLENISRRGVVCREMTCGSPQTSLSALE